MQRIRKKKKNNTPVRYINISFFMHSWVPLLCYLSYEIPHRRLLVSFYRSVSEALRLRQTRERKHTVATGCGNSPQARVLISQLLVRNRRRTVEEMRRVRACEREIPFLSAEPTCAEVLGTFDEYSLLVSHDVSVRKGKSDLFAARRYLYIYTDMNVTKLSANWKTSNPRSLFQRQRQFRFVQETTSIG